MISPLFIVGSQRSGTTLLRLLLNSHSQVAIPEEGTFWLPLIRACRRDFQTPLRGRSLEKCLDYLGKNAQFHTWDMRTDELMHGIRERGEATLAELMASFYTEYARQNGKQYWGDKSPGLFNVIGDLYDLFPGGKFIHIVRDGRDVFLSMRKMANRRNVAVSALEWKYKLAAIKRSTRRLPEGSCREVRYEDLLSDPAGTVRDLCDFIGVGFEESMMDFWKTSERYIGRHHSDMIFKPIDPALIGKWKRHMDPREASVFQAVAGGHLERFGYELVRERSPLKAGIRAAGNLCIGLPRRMLQAFGVAVALKLALFFGSGTTAAGGKHLQGK